jgi:peptidyl-prolyl cis-trans isomerase SurA
MSINGVFMKKIIFTGFMLLNVFAGCAYSAPHSSQPHTGQQLDGIVAIINESVITESEMDAGIERMKKQLAAANTSAPTPAEIRKHVLDQLIDRKLQLQLAEQGGLKVTDEDVNKAIAGIATQNKLSVKDLYEHVAQSGMDVSEYKKEIREEMVLQGVEQHEVGAHITILPQEIDDYMRSASWKDYNNKEYHLEDILIALPATPSPQDVATAKKQAEDVLAKIRKGMSFSQAAAADSGNSQALQGGDLGWLKLPQIPPAFSTDLVHMKVNGILGPVASVNGFHIIRLSGIRNVESKGTAAEQRKQVEQLIFQRKMEEGLQSWIAKIRSEAFINTHPEA